MREAESLKSVLQDLSLTQKKTLSEEVLDRVREAIVSGRFRPGDGLSESMLATAFGVSRGPVREALSQLQQEGLVVIERYRGAKVTRISQEDVEELYELRADLERFAVKRAARLISAGELEKMGAVVSAYREAVEGGSVQEAVDLDMRFHDLIYRAGQHTRLYSCWSTLLRSQIHAWILSCSFVDPSYMIPCVTEHQAIHDALKAHDRDRAVELIEQHLGDAYERLTQMPFEDK